MLPSAPRWPVVLAFCLVAGSAPVPAQEGPAEPDPDEVETAAVQVDGETVLNVRGAGAFTAERRAAAIASRIVALAKDASFDPAAIRVEELPDESRVVAGSTALVRFVDADAGLAALDRPTLAKLGAELIRQAIVSYRAARTRAALVEAGGRASAALALALAALVVLLRLGGWLERRMERRARDQPPGQEVKGLEALSRERLWLLGRGLVRILKRVGIAFVVFFFLRAALVSFPWTRGAGHRLGGWVLDPLAVFGRAFVAKLPDLIFLVVLYFLIRVALRVLRHFFAAVGRGDVKLTGFYPDWAEPTYKLLRIAVVAFAVVIAYPYVPGSSTEAFKGISIFFGLLVSIGASSIVGNAIAGFAMTYRRAFREGDVIRIDDTFGRVTSARLVVTHLRTPKNEEVVVPNSRILAADVVNYSTLARSHGLILHTTVGIGYETPWRQVEAMLLEAARRTPGLKEEPAPFVWQKALGDFAITYELNVACDDATQMPRLYTEVHRRILDVFNENGVQIMTPAYEGDTELPKIVPPDRNDPPLVAPVSGVPGGGATSRAG